MGREIRRVPPDWEHPFITAEHVENCEHHHSSYIGHPGPLFDKTWRQAADEWMDFARSWLQGDRPEFVDENPDLYPPPAYPWEYDEPPIRCYYREREWTEEEATAYQVYETVSEGTPVSPVLATQDDIVVWVMAEWGLSHAAASEFARRGWAPSVMVVPGKGIASNAEVYEPGFLPDNPPDSERSPTA